MGRNWNFKLTHYRGWSRHSSWPYLQPTPDAPLVADIFLSKTGFEIFLLRNNYYELQQKEYWKQQEKSPRQSEGKCTSNVYSK
jgi:hypothetical protein